jgi:hypothetical protein
MPALLRRILAWPLWGVLLCGVTNALLYERGGELFQGQMLAFLLCLVVLPIIGGFLTPEKPLFAALIFAFGSVPPLNDMAPMSIGLWPFYWSWTTLHGKIHVSWVTWLAQIPAVLVVTAAVLLAMSIPYAVLVCIGWRAKSCLARWFHFGGACL